MGNYTIVVGADLADSGDIALFEAMQMAKRIGGADLHAVHSLSREPKGIRNVERMSAQLQKAFEQLRQHVEWAAHGAGIEIQARLHARFGEPADVLHQVAIDYDADVIIVGTRPRSAAARTLLGSVAEHLVRIAHLPVVVARRKDFTGLAHTPAVEPAPSNYDPSLHEPIETDLVTVGPGTPHISGLI